MRVPADRAWVATGLYVEGGEAISIRAVGSILWSTSLGASSGPEGSSGGGALRPVPTYGVGALIGRVGNKTFYVGSGGSGPAPERGQLLLGINDDKFEDNQGYFVADIRTQGGGRPPGSNWGGSWGGPSWGNGSDWTGTGGGWSGSGPYPPGWDDPWDDSRTEFFRWRGRVDGADDILIRGNQVRIEHRSALPIQNQDYRFSAPLPRGLMSVRLRTIRGRGPVQLLEQPNSRNKFTAVVRVDDGRPSGADEYEFELSWNPPASPPDWGSGYPPGASREVFRWRGRVDIGAEVSIHDQRHHVVDMGGQGTREVGASFSSPLPEAQIAVSLRKVRGRGRVELVSTPGASNRHTAMVRIEDPKGGADDYEFELTWPRR